VTRTRRRPCRGASWRGDVDLIAVAALLLLATTALTPAGVAAQIQRSPPPEGARTHTVVPGGRYEAGAFKRWFFGSGYRDVWTAPIEVPVLDLGSKAGGLTVTETGGFGQTISLEFLGADGLEYGARSVDKDPTRRLNPLLQGTVVASIIQDQMSGFLPTAGLIVDPLLDATGILHPTHELVVVPDDPRLGEFREDFAGLIAMFVDRPQEGPDNTPGFAGSTRISGTENFLEELEEGACNRVDAREYLKARLMDLVVGDRDRHAGQWRWARYPEGPDCYVWRPIPEDRDQAFIANDGFMMSIYRLITPMQVKFGPKYPSLLGLTFNGWEVDRRILPGLDEPVWAEVAEEVREELTDAVIEEAVHRLPESHYALRGEWLERSLKARRDALLGETLAYYRMMSRATDVTGTDRDEVAVVEHHPNGTMTLSIRYADGPRSDAPYFQRTFWPDVTDEVRVYLHGGDDRVEVRGGRARIIVRVIGGGGDDTYENLSAAGGRRTRFYDDRGDNRFEGRAHVDRDSFERPPASNLAHQYALDWGSVRRYIPLITYSPDIGAQFGVLFGEDRYGFRKVPWRARHTGYAGVATGGPDAIFTWDARFREALGPADLLFRMEYTGINILRFYGFGNATEGGDRNFFKVEQRELTVAPAIEWTFGYDPAGEEEMVSSFRPEVRVGLGPVLKYSDTPLDDNADRFIGTLDPAPYGVGGFAQLGMRGWVDFDRRDNEAYPTSGFRVLLGGAAYPAMLDVDEAFGTVEGAASTYLTPGSARRAPTLALRAGAKKVFGPYPFHEAAYVGGIDDVRGYREERFAGDAALFANAEARLPLAAFSLLFPTEFGILGATDMGRVFYGEDPAGTDDWHASFGGGVWLSFLDRRQTVAITVMHGDDLTGVYVRAGLHF